MSLKLLCLFTCCLILASCGDSIESGLNKQIAETDSIKVYFFDEKTGATKNIITIADKNEVQILMASISDETSESYKCGYTGQLEFYKADSIILSPEFNNNESCPHYVFMYRDNIYRKVMTPAGRELLTGMNK